MKKREFLERLLQELKRDGVTDALDILEEYTQHFDFKLADGYTEEEICASLGSPGALAEQFREAETSSVPAAGHAVALLGGGFADIWAVAAFVLLMCWGLVMGAFALACAGVAVCLLLGQSLGGLLPAMPYWCGAVFAVSLGTLALLTGCGVLYFSAFLRQLARAYVRLRQNFRCAILGKAKRPPLGVAPQLKASTRRVLRGVALGALTVFAISAMLGIVVSMLSAGEAGFWHAWGWFGYGG